MPGGTVVEFDHLVGVITDGFVGAVGGLVGTTVMTLVFLVAAQIGAFNLDSFATLADLTGTRSLVSVNPTAVGYALFLFIGMVPWPLFFASIGWYLPGDRFATKGLPFGFILWTGFAIAYYDGYTGTSLVLYLLLTLLGHFAYGFALGAVFDYLSERPETLV
ncbi:DUF6789 family protein [Halobacteriaceae archaeon GCM10025711]